MSEHDNEFKKIMPVASDSQVYESIRAALADARTRAFNAINSAMVTVYWEIGREIAEAVGDRCESAHQANLFDIDARYADVEPVEAVLARLRDLPEAGQ